MIRWLEYWISFRVEGIDEGLFSIFVAAITMLQGHKLNFQASRFQSPMLLIHHLVSSLSPSPRIYMSLLLAIEHGSNTGLPFMSESSISKIF